MALDAPNLDDRSFQDLVDEAKRAIPVYTPEWTDHNVSDPGVTLIELFAWMTETMLYRLNRVPDKNYIKFLDMIGVRLQPPKPAMADITFRLSEAQTQPVTIPAGTEVATVRTSTDEAITFTTDRDLTIAIPAMVAFLTTPDSTRFEDRTRFLLDHDGKQQLFEEKPHDGNAFYIGLTEGLSGNTLALRLGCDTSGVGIDPRHPPLAWEYWSTEYQDWRSLDVESDSTKGLNQPGIVELYLPYEFGPSEVNGRKACWVRCRATRVRGKPFYSQSPRLDDVTPVTVGGTVPASNNIIVIAERLGRSTGTAGQVFTLANTPVLPRRGGEVLLITPEGREPEEWQEIEDFANSGPTDKHYLIDSTRGELQFGPRIWEYDSGREAHEVQKGAIPIKDALLTFTRYRYGGGTRGNVGTGTISVLKSSIPYIDPKVTNRRPAGGGLDQEDLENAKRRGPLEIRAITRAVTAEDYEYLARKATDEIARARCLQPRAALQKAVVSEKGINLGAVFDGGGIVPPGAVKLLLVPSLAADAQGRIGREQLALPERVRRTVRDYLDERRLLTTVLDIDEPRYRWVNVEAIVALKPKADSATVRAGVERVLNLYINPLVGGPDGDGWPFGRDLFISEVYSHIQGVSGVDYVRDVKLFYQDDPTGQRTAAGESVAPPTDGLLVSGEHKITAMRNRSS